MSDDVYARLDAIERRLEALERTAAPVDVEQVRRELLELCGRLGSLEAAARALLHGGKSGL